MSTRCRPGDLAMIVRDEQDGATVGRIVMVDEPMRPYNGMPQWSCSQGGARRMCPRCGLFEQYVCISDAWLVPIRPRADDEHEAVTAEVSA